MLFHDSTVFGKVVNYPETLANTVLGIIWLTNLNAEFLQEEVNGTREAIQSSGGTIQVIISDNNQIRNYT